MHSLKCNGLSNNLAGTTNRRLTKKSMMPVELQVNNSSAIELAKNLAFHSRTKHIDVRYHYIWMSIENKWIKDKHVPSEEQLADIMTKERSSFFIKGLK